AAEAGVIVLCLPALIQHGCAETRRIAKTFCFNPSTKLFTCGSRNDTQTSSPCLRRSVVNQNQPLPGDLTNGEIYGSPRHDRDQRSRGNDRSRRRVVKSGERSAEWLGKGRQRTGHRLYGGRRCGCEGGGRRRRQRGEQDR